jgi:hypothetical protein
LVAFKQWTDQEEVRLRESLGKKAPIGFWEELRDLIRLGQRILQHYRLFTRNNPDYAFKYVATEYEFSVPIPNQLIYLQHPSGRWQTWVTQRWGPDPTTHAEFVSLYTSRGLVYNVGEGQIAIPPLYVGRLDGLVLDENEHVHVIDHKFMAQLVDPEMLLLDTQTARYVWAANLAIDNGWWPEVPQGTRVRGALYNVCRKKAPVVPPMTEKTQRTSAAKNIDTTYEVFKATLLDRGEDLKDYREVLLHLKTRGNKFFQLHKIERRARELELTGERLSYEYEELARIASFTKDVLHPALYPSPTMDCRWSCSFKQICYIANWGGDVEHMIDAQMERQERRDLYATQLDEDVGEV